MGLSEVVAAVVSALGGDEAIAADLMPRVKAGLFYLTNFRSLTIKTGDKAMTRRAVKP
jgi:hypothetical protein